MLNKKMLHVNLFLLKAFLVVIMAFKIHNVYAAKKTKCLLSQHPYELKKNQYNTTPFQKVLFTLAKDHRRKLVEEEKILRQHLFRFLTFFNQYYRLHLNIAEYKIKEMIPLMKLFFAFREAYHNSFYRNWVFINEKKSRSIFIEFTAFSSISFFETSFAKLKSLFKPYEEIFLELESINLRALERQLQDLEIWEEEQRLLEYQDIENDPFNDLKDNHQHSKINYGDDESISLDPVIVRAARQTLTIEQKEDIERLHQQLRQFYEEDIDLWNQLFSYVIMQHQKHFQRDKDTP
jgi:hypothetical protein